MAIQRNWTKGDETRREILQAAEKTFGKHGYVNAEIKHIMVEAGKSSGTFYSYFKNKSDVLMALIDQFDSDLLSNLDITRAEDGTLRADPATWQQRHRSIWQAYSAHSATFFALAQAATVSEEFHTAYGRLRQRAIDDYFQIVTMYRAKGLCLDLDPAITAIALEAMVNGFLYECLAAPEHKISQAADLAKAADTLIRLIAKVLDT